MRRRALVLAPVLLAAHVGGAVAATEPELEQLREAIHDSRRRVGGFEQEERELLDQLEGIDRRLVSLVREVARSRSEAEAAREAHREASARATAASTRLARTSDAMSRRVVALYKAGDVGAVHWLFTSDSPRELLTRISALREVLESDSQLVLRFREERDAQAQAQAAAEAAALQRDAAALRLAEHSRQLAAERRSKRGLLVHARGNRSQERAVLIELEKSAHALEETVSALGGTPHRRDTSLDAADFEGRRAELPAPVDAPIAHAFGPVVDQQFLTRTFRNGVEFAAGEGAWVHAVAPGEVRFAGWFRGYGRIVILDHGGGYFTVSGHLAEIFSEVGDRLAEGDRIGSVGETGSLTGPSLYFEIRRGSQPLDPAEWLRAPRGG